MTNYKPYGQKAINFGGFTTHILDTETLIEIQCSHKNATAAKAMTHPELTPYQVPTGFKLKILGIRISPTTATVTNAYVKFYSAAASAGIDTLVAQIDMGYTLLDKDVHVDFDIAEELYITSDPVGAFTAYTYMVGYLIET